MWKYSLFTTINGKFQEQFNFQIKELSCGKLIEYLHGPRDASSLAVTRILFGLAMLFDIPDERGGANMDLIWGNPMICHFPLIPFISNIGLPYIAMVYAALWIGALGITLGYKYRLSGTIFTLCYWYIYLIEKSYWNNHSYLFGVVAFLLTFTEANCYWSLDSYLDPSLSKETVPYWNYFILKYQFFILYFIAGLKKGTSEWLTGYSVQNLSVHWVFTPFKLFLTEPQIDNLIVHWFIFVFDLTIAIWLMWSRTRHVAMIFCTLFHLMNSRLFRIGMFPWVCLATIPLFFPFDWPKIIINYAKEKVLKIAERFGKNICMNTSDKGNCSDEQPNEETFYESKEFSDIDENDEENEENDTLEKYLDRESGEEHINEKEEPFDTNNNDTSDGKTDRRKLITFAFVVFHVLTQAFLPYSHFITKGYNNWTNGLYGYSWDMMVHTWEVNAVIVKVVDNDKNKQAFVDPYRFTPNDRWTRHGDMVHQYARCLKDKILRKIEERSDGTAMSDNISIYVDTLYSMNGRFAQRMFDPYVDLLNASWSPFEPTSYLLPLLDEALDWRSLLFKIRKEVNSWNNYSDAMFIADFPGRVRSSFVPPELYNVSLTVLEGTVAYKPKGTRNGQGLFHRLSTGNRIKLDSETSHNIVNIGKTPAFYMYTYANKTIPNLHASNAKKILPVGEELYRRFKNMIQFANIIVSNLYRIFYKCS